jgi:hypothetical protein
MEVRNKAAEDKRQDTTMGGSRSRPEEVLPKISSLCPLRQAAKH